MHDQCSMNDLKEITASIRMAKSVLGDTCDSAIVKMSHVHYSETCDLDKAAMCLRSVNISYMVEHSDKIGQHTVCRWAVSLIRFVDTERKIEITRDPQRSVFLIKKNLYWKKNWKITQVTCKDQISKSS
jgi:hypothetical protein